MKDAAGQQKYTIRELAAATGVSVASIKFYVRDGLLHAGDLDRPGRAFYGNDHVARLRLIRALREIGSVPIATIRELLSTLDRGGAAFEVVAKAMDAMRTSRPERSAALAAARSDIRKLLGELGVRSRADAGAVEDLAHALLKLRGIWGVLPAEKLLPYARMMRKLARLEVNANRAAFAENGEGLLRVAVLGTVLFEPVLIAFRRVMHEDLARRILERPPARRPRKRAAKARAPGA